jgi:hypothetical protein
VRDYLRKLLETLWDDGECFSGKRPFGNSGWEWEIYDALGRAGFIAGVLAEQHFNMSSKQKAEAHAYVLELITAAFHGGAE